MPHLVVGPPRETFKDLAISEMEMIVILDRQYSIPRNLHSVGPDLSPRPLLDAQVLVVSANALMHMLNANLLIVVAILNDRVLQTRGRSAQVISSTTLKTRNHTDLPEK